RWVAGALEAKVTLRDFPRRAIRLAFETKELLVDQRQTVRRNAPPEEAAVRMEQVEMGQAAERRALAREDVARFEKGEVERLAVVAYERAGTGELLGEPAQ